MVLRPLSEVALGHVTYACLYTVSVPLCLHIYTPIELYCSYI